jgi:hypothetical protein
VKKSFAFLFVAMAICSCLKDDSEVVFALPPKTQTGQNVLGFMLDESVWTNHNRVCFPFAGGCRDNVTAFYRKGDMEIQADRVIFKKGSRKSTETLSFSWSTDFRGLVNYSTFSNDTIGVVYSFSEPGQPEKNYTLSPQHPNFSIRLNRLDTINKIVSGEFFGTLYSKALDTTNAISITDSIVIQSGRFDIKLR